MFFLFKCDNPGQPATEPVLTVWKKYDGPIPDIGQSLSKIDLAV
jgi:hypothetical protein